MFFFKIFYGIFHGEFTTHQTLMWHGQPHIPPWVPWYMRPTKKHGLYKGPSIFVNDIQSIDINGGIRVYPRKGIIYGITLW